MPFFILFICIIFGLVGYNMAKSRNLDLFTWTILCFLFGPIALIILAAKDAAPAPARAVASSPSYMQPTMPIEPPKAERYDRNRWAVLKEVDADIAKAAAEVSALSPAYEAKLAEKFLTLNDKSYLPTLVENIRNEHLKKEEAKAVAVEQADVVMDDRKKAARIAREERAKATMAEIEANDMYSEKDQKRVVSMEMYFGEDSDLWGHVKIVFEDGKAVLRAGDYFTIVPANFA